jgi:hypothetical protein
MRGRKREERELLVSRLMGWEFGSGEWREETPRTWMQTAHLRRLADLKFGHYKGKRWVAEILPAAAGLPLSDSRLRCVWV